MADIESFIAQFTDETLEFDVDRTQYFVPGESLKKVPLLYKTTRLGVQRGKKFIPSVYLLNWLAKRTDLKAVINEKSAWLFICGNNVLKEGFVDCPVERGSVLVLNETGDVLGYGNRTGSGITNNLNIGYFLHRES